MTGVVPSYRQDRPALRRGPVRQRYGGGGYYGPRWTRRPGLLAYLLGRCWPLLAVAAYVLVSSRLEQLAPAIHWPAALLACWAGLISMRKLLQ